MAPYLLKHFPGGAIDFVIYSISAEILELHVKDVRW